MNTEDANFIGGDYKNAPNILIESDKGMDFELLRRDVLAWLGYWRDKIPNEAISNLQDILKVNL